jgi:tetratricopeptide (TPR) repeat protein
MAAASPLLEEPGRLIRLQRYLAADPTNLRLMADAAAAAHDEGDYVTAAELLDRHEELAQLPPSLRNLEGLGALSTGRFEEARDIFVALAAERADDPAVLFNLAWAHSGLGDHEAAYDLVNEEVVAAMGAAAATLKVRSLHHLGRLEEALEAGAAFAEAFPEEKPLMGALALAALDAGQAELAASFARRGGDHPEGLSAAGLLMMNEGRSEDAEALFDDVLARRPDSARALVGKGLSLVSSGKAEAGAAFLQRGAELFGDHLGSWVAAGWARYVAGDLPGSRKLFERSMAIDDSFAENHGALAVLDIAQGDLESARRRTDIALRLDARCFSGALARSMLLELDGKGDAAQRVRELALKTPIGTSGQTIGAAMMTMAAKRR